MTRTTDSTRTRSYRKHAEHLGRHTLGGDRESHGLTWLDTDTVDAWRHQRMYKTIDPLLVSGPLDSWLTVGDGRYGNDAKYIADNGNPVMATDISDVLLAQAKSSGHIPAYRIENAESLSFPDDTYDYVFCKESYHHFPRPSLALYEMIRVARKGVVLIEPNDTLASNRLFERAFRQLKNAAKMVLGRKPSGTHTFEDSGNYLYGVSRRELEKVALGIGLFAVAFRGLNDAYLPGVEHEQLSDRGPLGRRTRLLILLANILCRVRLVDYGLLTAIIFKQSPDIQLMQRLRVSGYHVITLPRNPYDRET